MRLHTLLVGGCVLLLFLVAQIPSACGETTQQTHVQLTAGPTPPVPILLAEETTTKHDGWSIRKVLGLVNNRTRVIQACVALMCLALFIMIKK